MLISAPRQEQPPGRGLHGSGAARRGVNILAREDREMSNIEQPPRDENTCPCCGAALVPGEPIYTTDEHLRGVYLPGRVQCSADCGGVAASEVTS